MPRLWLSDALLPVGLPAELPCRRGESGAYRRRGGGGGTTDDSTGVRDKAPHRDVMRGPVFQDYSGGVLLSQGDSPQVPSALAGLTSVFGMGTGVTPPLWPPENVLSAQVAPAEPATCLFERSIASTSDIVPKPSAD